jgi:hypothetical protein
MAVWSVLRSVTALCGIATAFAAQQFRLSLLSLKLSGRYGSTAVVQLLSDMFQGRNRLTNNRTSPRQTRGDGGERHARAKQFSRRRRQLCILRAVWAG